MKISTGPLLLVLCCAAIALHGQVFTTLVNFDGKNGQLALLNGSLVQGGDGYLYGTTRGDGFHNDGTIIKLDPATGTLFKLHAFHTTDGASPVGTLIEEADGSFYGVTNAGGTYNLGTFYRLAPDNTITTLFTFDGAHGSAPYSLIRGADGNFYGVTEYGGASFDGVFFGLTPSGSTTALTSFTTSTGSLPTALTNGVNQHLYGITDVAYKANGSIFEVNPLGVITPIHFLRGSEGNAPNGPLVLATDGQYYGTTSSGGNANSGTIFKVTPTGTLTVVLDLSSTTAAEPLDGLIQATDGNFYGTTFQGGDSGVGTIFRLTPGGIFTILHSFSSTGSSRPEGVLFQSTDGNLYGATQDGGTGGTLFRLSTGLQPFVIAKPSYGVVGTPVTILGTNLAGATSVTFNGAAAPFTVSSATKIESFVPAGATSGVIQVTTSRGTLISKIFNVTP